MTSRQVLRSRRVELPGGTAAADVVIESGRIAAVNPHGEEQQIDLVRDFGTLVLAPGLVDTHVHLNEPGRSDWEGFLSGTSAAKAGGVTTLVDMPLNSSPVTTSPQALDLKRAAADGKLCVDVGFHAGLVPENAEHIDVMIRSGSLAAKAFLCPSGIDEFRHIGERDLRIAMPKLAQCGAKLMVHAELVHDVAWMTSLHCYDDYKATRPASFERNAIEMMIRLAREYDCDVHIVHLADAGSLPMIAQARDEGLRLTVETCPHYLYFASESIADSSTQYKCAPPIRDAANRDGLWQGLRDGLIDLIVSDHSPCPPAMKELDSGRFDKAWGGISSLQLGLPIIWTEAARRGFTLRDVIDWMSKKPAALLNIPQGIKSGNPAHLFVLDPDASFVVDQSKLLHRHPITPYHGETLRGVVRQTFVHGHLDDLPRGKLL